jgi:hypothetical protein
LLLWHWFTASSLIKETAPAGFRRADNVHARRDLRQPINMPAIMPVFRQALFSVTRWARRFETLILLANARPDQHLRPDSNAGNGSDRSPFGHQQDELLPA